MSEHRRFSTMQERIDALDCMGEIEGFLTELRRREGQLDEETIHAIARRKVDLARGKK